MPSYRFLRRVSSFAGRAVIFFFMSSMLLFFFYLLGNYQDFLDNTQRFLLACLHGSLLVQLLFSIYFIILLVLRAVREKRLFLLRFTLLVLSLAASVGLLVAVSFLQSWAQS